MAARDAADAVLHARAAATLGRWVVPAALVLLSILQSPGKVTFDTDLDLALNPSHLMSRAMHLWGADSGFGGVGDQTYGFLFPMAPFFALGDWLQLPDWLVQRLWCGLVLVVAYEGFRRLVLAMITPRRAVAVVAALGWALTPRMLTVVGPFSAEAVPAALLPWILLPLVLYLPGHPRRAAWLSGLAMLFLGSVNATATLAVLPVPGLFLLTRPGPWRSRARALGWWLAAVVLASAWWVGPLLLLGAYSPPFTDWVESAATTTNQIGAFPTLRGATDWVAYVPETGHGFWPAGWDLATSSVLIVATSLVAVLGLAGLASRAMPERRFAVLTAVLGFAVLTVAHAGSPASPVSEGARSLLDGPLSPFRNIYKFDSVLRLPLALGLAFWADRAVAARLPARIGRRLALGPTARSVPAMLALPLVVGLLAVVSLPALRGDLRPGPGFAEVPQWWTDAADYLAEDADSGRTLVLPEAVAGRYTWGRTIGEPLEALARSPWAVRNQVPLTAPGNTRLVDAVEGVLASGRGSPALADVFARSGVGQVLVRNDLDPVTADRLPPVRVRQALERSPGMRRVREFGPPQPPRSAKGLVDGGIDDFKHPALELWVVDRPVSAPQVVALADVAMVSGGPENLLGLLESGLVARDQPTVLAGDVSDSSWEGPRLVTDGLQRRERSFGRVHQVFGPVLTRDEPFRQVRAAHDLLPFPGEGHQTTAAFDGLSSVTASSSGAYPDNYGGTRLDAQPAAALDGDASTAWLTGSLRSPVGAWLQVIRTEPSNATTVTVRLVNRPYFGPTVTSVRLETDAGSVVHAVAPTENPQVLQLPAGAWQRLRITVDEIEGGARLGVVGLSELTLPGLPTTRTLVAPFDLPAGPTPPSMRFAAADPVEPCVLVDGLQRCNPSSVVPSDEGAALDRTFTVDQAQEVILTGSVLPAQGQGVARLLRPLGAALSATVSTSLDGGGAVGAAAAIDGNTRTSWVAHPLDSLPALGLAWPIPQRISGLQLVHADQPATSAPARVHLTSPAGDRDAVVRADGTIRFAPLTTSSVILTFPVLDLRRSTDGRSGLAPALPVGVAEVRLPEVPFRPAPAAPETPTGSFCGFGPTVELDGKAYPSQVHGTVADLKLSRPLQLSLCNDTPLLLTAGTHRLRISATTEFFVRSAQLADKALPVAQPLAHRSVTVQSWEQTRRSIEVGPGERGLLVVPEAANAGWVATLAGRRLTALPADGWQQGWILPAGSGGQVKLEFPADRVYQLSLVVGGACALLLLLLVGRTARRWGDVPPETREALGALHAEARPLQRTLVAAALLGSLCVATGGVTCLLGLCAGFALGLLRRGLLGVASWGSLLAAALVVLVDERNTPTVIAQNSATAQALCLLAIGALAATLLLPAAARQRDA